MSNDKVKIITEGIIYKSIITILQLVYVFLISIVLQSQTNKSTLKIFAIEVILAIVMVSVSVNFISVFMDIKNRIKLKRNSGI